GKGGGHIPRFGDWKSSDGGTPYTVFFDDARKRKNAGHRTPPHGAGSSTPQRNKDPASRPRSQSAVGHGGGSVPAWGQWNEGNAGGGGAQQYTLMFDQIRDERRGSAPSTPTVEQLQRATPTRYNQHNQHANMRKRFTCFGLCLK
ncbi:Os11g0482200, partial [Oryza sativa Japonica Group]